MQLTVLFGVKSEMRTYYRPRFEQLDSRLQLAISFIETGEILGHPNTADIELGDLDQDGDLDIALAFVDESTLGTWLNYGDGTFEIASEVGDGGASSLSLGDLDGDGDLDAVVGISKGKNATENWDRVFLNDSNGSLATIGQTLDKLSSLISLGLLAAVDPSYPSYEPDTYTIGVADLDGDSDFDVLAGTEYGLMITWMNSGAASFTPLLISRVPTNINVLTSQGTPDPILDIGDLDGDGDLDAYIGRSDSPALSNTVWLNSGAGEFVLYQSASYRPANSVLLGDLDSDGDLDVVTTHDVSSAKVWLNDGLGGFTDSGQSLENDVEAAALGDLDGDGDLDIIFGAGYVEDGLPGTVWLNDGNGMFERAGREGVASTWNVRAIEVGDLDGDLDLDVVVSVESLGVTVWLNERDQIGASTFSAGDANRDSVFDQLDIVLVLQGVKYQSGESASWAEGDWNGDGVFDQLDIVAALQTGNYLQGPYAADAHFAAIGG